MEPSTNTQLLFQQWLHSKEEDTSTERVYRPVGYSFPPSRGRSGFEFTAEGGFKRIGVGANDIAAVSEGTWELVGNESGRVRIRTSAQPGELVISSIDADRLTVAKES